LAVEEGFIQYSVEVKGAAKVSQEFKAMADAAIKTGSGFERLDQYVRGIEQRMPKMAARLRESSKSLQVFAAAQKASALNGTTEIDARYRAHVREKDVIEAKTKAALEAARVDKLDNSLQKSMDGSVSAIASADERSRAQEVGKETAARERLNAALKQEAQTRKLIGDSSRFLGTGNEEAIKRQIALHGQLNVDIRETANAQRSMAAASKSSMEQSELGLATERHAREDLSRLYLASGTALLGLGVAAVVVGAQFEAAFANVERTLDPAEFGAGELETAINGIRSSLVQLSGEIPVTFAELANIATIGNQMDIAAEDLIGFTSTIARFSSVSGMSIDEVSKAFGGFMAQTGLAPEYLENFGSALAYVSIKSNATEAEILSVSREIAALSAGAGLSADEIVGLAGTLSALRVPPERSRGSLETYFQTLRRAVAGGGQDLENFATVVGVTAGQLDEMVRSGQGAEVLEGFLTTLNNVDTIQMTQALDELGLSQLRVGNTFTRLSQNVETFRNQLEYSKSAFMDGAELNRQYEITLDTLNSQWIIFVNGINALVAAISGGAVGSFGELFQIVNSVIFAMVELLNKNPWAAKIGAIALAVVATVGAFLLLRGAAMGVHAALLAYQLIARSARATTIGLSGGFRSLTGAMLGAEIGAKRTTIALRALKLVSRGLVLGGAIAAAGFLAEKLTESSARAKDASLGMDEYAKITEQARKKSRGAANENTNLADSLAGGGGGGGSPSVADAAEKAAAKISLLTDYASELQGVFKRSFSLRFDTGASMDSVTSKWIKLTEELEKYQQEVNKLTADRSLRAYWLSVAELYDDQLRAAQLRSEIAEIDVDLAKANKGASRELEGNTQAAIDNRSTMRDLLTGYQDYLEALARSGASQQVLQSETARLSGEFKDQAAALGFSAGELETYAATFLDLGRIVEGVPRNITIGFDPDPATQALSEFFAKTQSDAAIAGSNAGSAMGGGIGDGISDGIGDSFEEAADEAESIFSDSGKKASQSWIDQFFDGVMRQKSAMDTLLAINGGDRSAALGDLLSLGDVGYLKEEAFTAGSDIQKALAAGIDQSADPFAVLRTKLALNKPLLAKDLYILGGDLSKVFSESEWSQVDPTGTLRERLRDGQSPTAEEVNQLAALAGASFDATLESATDPVQVLLAKIGSGLDLTANEARILADNLGFTFDDQLEKRSDPISRILTKIKDGKQVTSDEMALLAGFSSDSYNYEVRKNAKPGEIITEKIQNGKEGTRSASSGLGSAGGSSFGDSFGRAIGSGLDFIFGGANSSARIRLRKVLGFQSGGYTGNGGVGEVAGVVHGREYVIPAKHVDPRTRLPNASYVESLKNSRVAPRGNGGSAGYQAGGFVGGGGAIELGEYTLNRIGRQVAVSLSVDKQQLASAASSGDARLAQRGSN
jgi:TP901 family phage tail tape measure protein